MLPHRDPRTDALNLAGGTDVRADLAHIKEDGCNIIVGTPGRLLDVMKRSSLLRLTSLEA